MKTDIEIKWSVNVVGDKANNPVWADDIQEYYGTLTGIDSYGNHYDAECKMHESPTGWNILEILSFEPFIDPLAFQPTEITNKYKEALQDAINPLKKYALLSPENGEKAFLKATNALL